MAYHIEKGTGDLVIDGFEKGIASSPHQGIANMQNINITTEPGEASVNYARTLETQQAITSGTLTRVDSTHLSYSGNPALLVGTWISVTVSSIGSPLTTGTYYVTQNNSGLVQLSTTNSSSNTLSGMGAGTATFNTTTTQISKLVASTTAVVGLGASVYFMMDANGVVLYRNPNNNYWQQLVATGPSNGNATGLCAFNGYLFRFYTDSTSGLGTVDYTSIGNIVGGNAVSFTVLGNTLSTFTHQALSGHDNTMYYTDGTYVGSIAPAYSSVTGYWTLAYLTSATVFQLTLTSGVTLVNGMPITLASSVSMPSGISPNFTYYIANVGTIDNTFTGAYAISNISAGATSGTLSTAWPFASTAANTGILVTFSDGERRIANFTNNSTTFTWTTGLSNNVTTQITIPGPIQTFSISTTQDGANIVSAGSNGTGILSLTSTYFNPLVTTSFTWNKNALQLPAYETAQCLAELGTNLMIGGATSNLYPWDRSSTTATTTTTSSFFYPVILPEPNTTQLVTVNNVLYIFCGYKGNVYITTGGIVSPVITIPDYVTGQNEPIFTWLSAMYLRGRIWFSVQAPNSGGVWSFVPQQNAFPQQDIGLSLRLENENSNGTYSGGATVLLPEVTQSLQGPQYWSGIWDGSTSYGIDFSATTPYTGGQALIETDAIPTGTLLVKQTFKQLEYKLSTALVAGESVQLYYRQDLGFNSNGAWTTCGTVNLESTAPLSGYFTATFQNTQWLQLRAILTSTASSPSFVRLKELRVR